MDTINARLRQARIEAGFGSARAAALRFGWSPSTYAAHENGQNGFDAATALIYAKAFNADPGWIVVGQKTVETTSQVRLAGLVFDFDRVYFSGGSKRPIVKPELIRSLIAMPKNTVGFVIASDDLWPRYDEGSLVLCRRENSSFGLPFGDEEVVIKKKDGSGIIGKMPDEQPQLESGEHIMLSHRRYAPIRIAQSDIADAWAVALIIPPKSWSFVDDDIREERLWNPPAPPAAALTNVGDD